VACGWLTLDLLHSSQGFVRNPLALTLLDWARCSLFPEPAALPCLQKFLSKKPGSRLRKGAPDCQCECFSHGEHQGHITKKNGGRETLVHRCHPLRAFSIPLVYSTVEAPFNRDHQ